MGKISSEKSEIGASSNERSEPSRHRIKGLGFTKIMYLYLYSGNIIKTFKYLILLNECMSGRLVVRPDKNEFLLYAMLNALGLARGNPDSHLLRRRTVDHFEGYSGLGLKQEDYIHHSKPVGYVLTINEAPDFSEKQSLTLDSCMQREVEIGRAVLPHLKHFYQNTDFENFYQKALPRYAEECEFLQGILDRANVRDLLDNVWEVDRPFNMEVIPMPLEGMHSGIGPSVGDTAYQIVGPPFDYGILHLVAHEGSHPRAKRALEPIADEIAARSHLLKHALHQPNYPSSYHHWPTCFEEHFIRAMQVGYIDPVLAVNSDVENRLKREEKGQGMLFIRDFYDELRKHKESPTGPLTDVALTVLGRLDQYKAKAPFTN